MKFLSIILAFTIFTLSTKPCSDGQNIEDQQEYSTGIEHNHQQDTDDSCPVTCICQCCGISITYEPLAAFNLIDYNKISTEIASTYMARYRFDFLSNIWQPPQVIS